MKATRIWLLAAACALTLAGQQDSDLHEWMETSDKAVAALKKLEPKTGQQAVTAAERLGGIYENMIAFWRQKNLNDAVKWSEEGKAAATQLASAANANNVDEAAAAFKTLTSNCMPCHKQYRERTPEGKYRLKLPAAAAN